MLCARADGLFDFYTNYAAVDLARKVLLRKGEALQERVQKASDVLVKAVAYSGHSSDNVTVVLAMLGDDPSIPFGAPGSSAYRG